VRFRSTRRGAPPVSYSGAILAGLAPDGGLYVPERFPRPDLDRLDPAADFPALALEVLRPFFEGDPLADALPELCREAFDFPMPLVHLDRSTAVLELFHGPTAAFKDFGARFLAASLARLLGRPGTPVPLTILVATSGDTGAAVAAAFHRRPGIRVGILFPRGGVAPRQEQQLTCWDDNVTSFAVRGVFDDCQRLVKTAFARPGFPVAGGLSSANSINVGRLLPQAVFYAIASIRYRRERGVEAGFVVPSGNLGNAASALWAKRMGFPLRHVALATNANRVVPDYFASGSWQPRPSIPTLANAMDVGDPSNMERVFDLYPRAEQLRRDASALSVDDESIRRTIAEGPARWGRVWCPHTATAVHLRERLGPQQHEVVVATAHPAKFDGIVEPLVGRPVVVPPQLAELLARPRRVTEIGATFEELARGLA
jgi:threonine synthase